MQSRIGLCIKGFCNFEVLLGPPSHVDAVAVRWDKTALGMLAVDRATGAWAALRNFTVAARGVGLAELTEALRNAAPDRWAA